jgi:hypothetical protein
MSGSYQMLTQPSDESQLQQMYIEKKKQLIPVIFLPGVMGSNLKNKNGDIIWRPETNSMDGITNLLGWALPYFGSAQVRRKDLNPNEVLVDDMGKIKKARKDNNDEHAFGPRSKRGWGTVANMSYGDFLPWLQQHLYSENGSLSQVLNKLIDMPSFTVDAGSKQNLFLDKKQVSLCDNYAFPVHAMGYNWLASIESSANALKNLIEVQLPQYYRRNKSKLSKVILVTHSMGGLVARYYTQALGGEDKVYGVVHGVLPSTGAPAAYTRMKQGAAMTGIIGKIVSEVIGDDAEEMTAVCSQSPGPLQLLPSKEYGPNWLTICHVNGDKESYPKEDPYKEIYLEKDKWWGLCEPHLINPLNTKYDSNLMKEDWLNYSNIIKEDVKQFHTEIVKVNQGYHPNTYAFYGIDMEKEAKQDSEKDTNKIKEDFLTYERVCWQGKLGPDFAKLRLPESDIENKRRLSPEDYIGDKRRLNLREVGAIRSLRPVPYKHDYREEYKLQKPKENGDNTVPKKSGEIPITYLKSRVGLDIGHEPAYKDKQGRSQEFTLRAIITMIQDI